MADIVLGIGTSHSPLLAIRPELWSERGKDDQRRTAMPLSDGRVLSYAELSAETADRFAGQAQLTTFQEISAQAHTALDRLAAAITDARVDVIVIIGDDQEELFSRTHMPALAIFAGREVVMHPKNEVVDNLPEWYREANRGYMMDTIHRHPATPDLATALIEALTADGVDLSLATEVTNPRAAGFGHAYGFVIDRLLSRASIPVLPVMLNTYFPPNVPTPRRCYEVGRRIGDALRALPDETRICVVASGGLTHFVAEADFDRRVLAAMERCDVVTLTTLPVEGLRSGNSEILNWVMTAGVFDGVPLGEVEYMPVYRTPAGTGIGMAFATWRP